MEGILVPIAMFLGLTIIITFFFWFRFRGRSEMQQTIRTAIDKGQELTPELVKTLAMPRQPRKDKDLRLALIWVAVAIGIALFGTAMRSIEDEVFFIMLGLASFPLMIGLAYGVLYRVTGQEK